MYCSVGCILRRYDSVYGLIETRGEEEKVVRAGIDNGDRKKMVGLLHILFPSAFSNLSPTILEYKPVYEDGDALPTPVTRGANKVRKSNLTELNCL